MDEVLIVILCVVGAVVAGMGCGYVNNLANNHAIISLVEKGSTPLEAKCVITPSTGCEAMIILGKK